MKSLDYWFKDDYCWKHQDEFMNYFNENINFDIAYDILLQEYFNASYNYNKLLINKQNISDDLIKKCFNKYTLPPLY